IYPTNMLQKDTKTPSTIDIQRTFFKESMEPINRGKWRTNTSSEITDEEELRPDDKLNMAAAMIHASTRAVTPVANPLKTNLGKRESACSTTLVPSSS